MPSKASSGASSGASNSTQQPGSLDH
jgi:hypothetical protein